jgi:Lipoprotein LpqB beta-propeller domain/Sporulation and spore germination
LASRARRLGGVSRVCLLAAAVTTVAGCVGMPSNGPVQKATASATSPAPDVNLVGPHPAGPQPGADPAQIVQGFLFASASYPTYPVAQEYLVSKAIKAWNPGWAVRVFSILNVPEPLTAAKPGHTASPQVSVNVNVTGTVQASFDGSGQYVSAQNQGQAPVQYIFKLVKVGGQWRITNPPDYRMLRVGDFPLFYKAQDLYFLDPQDQVLVPDSVFVPLGTTVSEVLDNLVRALLEGPATPWLEGAADTELPAATRLLGVTPAGSTVTVNLGGPLSRDSVKTGLFAAQLVWTLTGSLPNIQTVVLEINGQPWTPHIPPCAGDRNLGPTQTLAAYECFDPYPSSSASFYYVNDGQLWARCGPKSEAVQGLIGPVVPLIAREGVFTSQGCGEPFVHEGSTEPPPAQPESLPALSMAAVSPDGRYLAVVASGNGDVYLGARSSGTAALLHSPRLTGGGVSALSFDGNDDLWVVQSGAIFMLPSAGKSQVPVASNGTVSELSIAPDGVRVAFVAQPPGAAGPALYLAAIGGGQQEASGLLGPNATHLTLKEVVSLGPGLQRPTSLAWYDADDLVVVGATPTGNTLWDVPVDGQSAQELPVTPSGVTSITADGDANVLVAGLSGHNLAVSATLEGPWYPLGAPGQSPTYPG